MNIDPNNPPENVEKWIKDLRRVINKMPRGLWLFAADGIQVMALKDGDRAVLSDGGMDPYYAIECIRCDIDGGDW